MPLRSLRIVDITQALAGPFATKILADMGAEVIKIEAATHPDVLRLWAPPNPQPPVYERNPFFHASNTNKLSMSLLLDTDRGREILLELVRISDIVIDNFSARVMPQLRLSYDDLRQAKEDIIVISMPAFGRSGPYEHYVGYGESVEVIAGLTPLTGYRGGRAIRMGIAISDYLASFNAAVAVLAASVHRKRTGLGQFIDFSQMEACARTIGEALVEHQLTGKQPIRSGNRSRAFAPQGCYPCIGDDEWVVISVETDAQWNSLVQLLGNVGLACDRSLARVEGRRDAHDRIDEHIARWTSALEKHEVMRACQASGIPAGAVLNVGQLMKDSHLGSRGFFEQVQHPVEGSQMLPGVHFKLSKTPAHLRTHAPLFGQHTDFVLRELLGKSDAEIASLRAEGVAGRPLEFDTA
jgi:crotonobetainyl-CoA:carnitine CoA-transferase CaiB-like acyl-CoA transferase